jgi:hypothetical protein
MSLIDGQRENTGPRPRALFLTVLLSVVTWGCSDRDPLRGLTLYPVKGKVTLPDGKTMPGLGPTKGSGGRQRGREPIPTLRLREYQRSWRWEGGAFTALRPPVEC